MSCILGADWGPVSLSSLSGSRTFYFSSPLNWRPRIHLIGTVRSAGWTVTWWLNCYCRSRKQLDTVSAYLPVFSPIIGLPSLAPCLLLAVMETH